MSRKVVILLFLLGLLGLAVGLISLLYIKNQKSAPKPSSETSKTFQLPKFSPAPTSQFKKNSVDYLAGELPEKPQADQIFYTDSGFVPEKINAGVGAIITIFNMSKTQKLKIEGIGDGNLEMAYGQAVGYSLVKKGQVVIKNSLDKSTKQRTAVITVN